MAKHNIRRLKAFAGFNREQMEAFWIDVSRMAVLAANNGAAHKPEEVTSRYEGLLMERICRALHDRDLSMIYINGFMVEMNYKLCEEADCTCNGENAEVRLRICRVPCVMTAGNDNSALLD